MIVKLMRSIWIACCMLLCGTVFADGVAVSAKYQPVTGGYRYFLSMYNDTIEQPSRYVVELGLVLWDGPTDLQYPSGWYAGSTTVSAWWDVAIAKPNPPNWWMQGIAPGGSLSGFNVTVPTLLDKFWYQVYTRDGVGLQSYNGWLYPEPVPEPSALLVLAGGLGALGLPMLRGRKRAASFRHR